MMKFIFYTATLVAIHFTMSVSAESVPITCSGTDPRLEHVLKIGLRILDNVMCPSGYLERKLAHLVSAVCKAILTEDEVISNQTCDLLRVTMNDTRINYPKCSQTNRVLTECNDGNEDFIQLWCSQALICSHLTGKGRVDDFLCDGHEDIPEWYNRSYQDSGEILYTHQELCPSAYVRYPLPRK